MPSTTSRQDRVIERAVSESPVHHLPLHRISEARRQRFPTAITCAAGCSQYYREELSRRTSRRHYRRHHRRRRLGRFAGPG